MRYILALTSALFAAHALEVTPAVAQIRDTLADIALKSGESADVTTLLWTVRCKSYFKGLPQVEILEGPPEVTATISETMMVPRTAGCAKKLPAGLLSIKAGEITEDSSTEMRLRIRYNTLDGRRDRVITLRVVLIPS